MDNRELIEASAYRQLIGSHNPGLIMIMIDQSYSMTDPYGGQTKAEIAAMAVNRVINEIVEASQDDDRIKDRCYVGVVGYGASVVPVVGGMISQLANNPVDIVMVMRSVSDGAGGLVEVQQEMPIWVKPMAENGTPMDKALESVYGLIEKWIQDHPDSFPPIVINITDGQPNDPSKTKMAAEKLMSLRTSDGNLLLFNAHISDASAAETRLPNNENGLYDNYAKLLFNISSILPDRLVVEARKVGFSPQSQARGFVFNAGAETMIKFLTFGSRVTLGR